MTHLLNTTITWIFLVVFTLTTNFITAQDEDTDDSQKKTKPDTLHKGLQVGVYVGTYFANKYNAGLYDGYGFDINGQRNDFSNSVLYNQIVNNYGGGYGGNDQIAQLLNVDHKDWFLNQGGMPINLRYTPTYIVGLNTRYLLNKKESVVLNINAVKLAVNGKFNINTIPSASSGSTIPNQTTQHQFTIIGAEQRLMFQLGYQKIIGNNEKLNFFIESGINVVMAKAQKNQAILNNNNSSITIDLMSVYDQPNYNYYRAKYFVGVGLGVFLTAGINLNINPKYTVQLFYSPSYDKIKLGPTPAFKIQHNLGLRFYYNIK